jgi:rhodanese-related sulfurtransferase
MEEVYAAVDSGSLLLDVRTPEEFAIGHFERATLLPLADIQAGKMPTVAKDKPLYVYCRSGNRSAEAVQLLRQAGFSIVVDLGGLSDVADIGGRQVR